MLGEVHTAHTVTIRYNIIVRRVRPGVVACCGDGVGGNFWGSGEPIYNQRRKGVVAALNSKGHFFGSDLC